MDASVAKPHIVSDKQDVQSLYGPAYYRNCCGDQPYERSAVWLSFFGSVAENLVRSLIPKTVFDAGCAMGLLVECLWDRGVRAEGADISEFAISQVRRDIRPFCRVASLAEPLAGHYDLVTCIEVLEHLQPEECTQAVANLTSITDTILFSSTPLDIQEATHFNVRPILSWLQLFSQQGFYPDLLFDASFVCPQSMLLRRGPAIPESNLILYSRLVMNRCQLHESREHYARAESDLALLRKQFAETDELRERNAEVRTLLRMQTQKCEDLSAENARLREAESYSEALESSLAGLHARSETTAIEQIEPLVDSTYYRDHYLRAVTRLSPGQHYLLFGAASGFRPHPLFDTLFYVGRYPDVSVSQLNPLVHFVRYGEAEGRWPNPYFDPVRYRRANPGTDPLDSLSHYIRLGAAQGCRPNPFFDADFYRYTNVDIREGGFDPYQHFVTYGCAEERQPNALFDARYWRANSQAPIGNDEPFAHFLQCASASETSHPLFDCAFYLSKYGDKLLPGEHTIEHFLREGAVLGLDPHPLFDTGYYRQRQAGESDEPKTVFNYLRGGAQDKHFPHPWFDSEFYLRSNADLRQAGCDPLVHFIEYGAKELRNPHPQFDMRYYLSQNPDIDPVAQNLLLHYLNIGAAKGCRPHPTFPVELSEESEPIDAAILPLPMAERFRIVPHTAEVSIVICVHNALDDVRRCLSSVVEYTFPPFEMVLIDDGSDSETAGFLRDFATQQGAMLIRNELATGYTFAANRGIRASTGEYVLLLNSDTIVTEHWLDRMVMGADSDPRIGLVGPLSNTASWQSVPEVFAGVDWATNDLPAGYSIVDAGRLLASVAGRVYPQVTFLNGFCLLMRRSLIDTLGLLDEEGFGRGYGEENDYCLRAWRAGWKAAIADDTYVFHAQSKSYSHEKRKELYVHSDEALRMKHGGEVIAEGLAVWAKDQAVAGVRARALQMFSRQSLVRKGRQRWEGKRVAFVLPVWHACGGANVVLSEARAMQRFGVEVALVNLEEYRSSFRLAYPNLDLAVRWAGTATDVPDLVSDFDLAIATAFTSVSWLEPLAMRPGAPHLGYYIQDFEPYFSQPGTPGYDEASASYVRIPQMHLFTKTVWNQQEVLNHTGRLPAVVGPSVEVDLFRPRVRSRAGGRNVKICAMVRPRTPYRAPAETMQLLRELKMTFQSRIRIDIFGIDDPDLFSQLPQDFEWNDRGRMCPEAMARFLSGQDIFIDASSHQALGLLAMEAMASGVAVIVPKKGGASSFARHEQNALIVDMADSQACYQAACRLIEDPGLREELQHQAIQDLVQYYPEQAAANILGIVFPK